jgi:hypothetical protein
MAQPWIQGAEAVMELMNNACISRNLCWSNRGYWRGIRRPDPTQLSISGISPIGPVRFCGTVQALASSYTALQQIIRRREIAFLVPALRSPKTKFI